MNANSPECTAAGRVIRRAAVALARGTDARIITAGHAAPDACMHNARETNLHYQNAWWSVSQLNGRRARYVAALRAVAGLAAQWMRVRAKTARAVGDTPTANRNRALIADEFRHRCRVACIPGANGDTPAPLDWLHSYKTTPPTIQ